MAKIRPIQGLGDAMSLSHALLEAQGGPVHIRNNDLMNQELQFLNVDRRPPLIWILLSLVGFLSQECEPGLKVGSN